MPSKHIGEFEQVVLLSILRQGDRAYAPGVRKELEGRASRRVSRGALYRTFDRLEAKGYLEWELENGSETPERGGQPMRRFQVTQAGLEALRHSRSALMNLWEGLDEVLEKP